MVRSVCSIGVRLPDQIGPEIDALAAQPAHGTALLWTRTDARDAAAACRLALEAADAPPGPYNITGAVVLKQSAAELVRAHFGSAVAVRSALEDHPSPLSTARAAAAFGYHPRYVWSETQRFPISEPTTPGATP